MKKIIEKLFIPIQLIILYFFNFIFNINSKTRYLFVIGVDEIANCTYYLQKAFKKESVSVNLTTNKFYKNNKYNYSISVKNKYLLYLTKIFYGPYLLAKLSNQADVFIYFWWTGFCIEREIDYKFLKKKKKKIVCIFVGSDIRSRKLLIDYCKSKNLDTSSNYLNIDYKKEERRVERVAYLADKYATLSFNHKIDQVSYLNNYINTFIYMVDDTLLEGVKFSLNKKIKILHAPSNPVSKGTQLVNAAIKKLQLEGYIFEYIELKNKQNTEILKNLACSDIVLNQFYAFLPGVFGIEAMAKRNAVLMSGDYENLPTDGKKPWLKTKYWQVYDNLKFLLDNPEKIEEYANEGYEFVKNNYTEKKVREFYVNTFYEHKIVDVKSIFQK